MKGQTYIFSIDNCITSICKILILMSCWYHRSNKSAHPELTLSLIINTDHQTISPCLNNAFWLFQFLYRLKEKLKFQIDQDKQQHQQVNLASIPVQQPQADVKVANSMVQPLPHFGAVIVNIDPHGRPAPEIKPCVASAPSPFKMKPGCLQER